MSNNNRKVSVLLGIGIFLFPVIFVWFTLRKGYSTKARVIGFSWLILGILAFFYAPREPVLKEQAKVTKNIEDSKSNDSINYQIRSDDKKRDIKRVVEIELPQRVTDEQLRNIADKIKNDDMSQYQRTFILFFIPEIKNSAWATVSFDPDFKLQMIGSTKAEHDNLASKPIVNSGKTIGKWNANWGYEYKIIIEEKNGKVFEQNIYADRQQPPKELNIIDVNGQKAYQDETGKDHGEYYIINKDGDLEFWSKNGNYYTAKKF